MSHNPIFTVDEYYDGPISGVTELNGKPHIYQCIFDENEDEYSQRYYLQQIPQDIFTLKLEQWELWLKWVAAFKKGEVTTDTHPVLPEDSKRNKELDKLTIEATTINIDLCEIMRAEFIVPTKPSWASTWQVRWVPDAI